MIQSDLPPDEKKLTNLLEKIPKEKQEEIGKEICEQYDADEQSRNEWKTKRADWYKLWACVREDKTEPWENCSNICIPFLASACNQFHARSYQAMFAPPGMAKALPVGENDVQRALSVERFLNWQTLYQMEEYEDEFDKLLQRLPINGIEFKKGYWAREEDRPLFEHVSALDVVVPYKTKNL
ncbi:MAG: hypothetical protein ACYS80_25880, partial [Planctomycetota bacterium]